MPGKGSTSSKKKKATARGRAAEKSASGDRAKPSVKQMSQGRYPGERPLTGEDRPANRRGGKVQGGPSAQPRGRGGRKEVSHRGATDRSPDAGMARPSPTRIHNI